MARIFGLDVDQLGKRNLIKKFLKVKINKKESIVFFTEKDYSKVKRGKIISL